MSAGFTLESKGDSRFIPVNQLIVKLKWTAAVDLDLMAFYKAKDGRAGGVYSDNYMGGSLGDLNGFPFMQLSGDEGVGDTGGDNEEDLRIVKLDDIAELHIVAVNFTDASSGANRTFSNYDGRVEVMTDAGETIVVPLDSNAQGSVATICKIVNTNPITGPQLSNESVVESFDAFKARVPGAGGLDLSSKIVLKAKGERANISLDGAAVHAMLRWRTAVDLDLHCYYRMKSDGNETMEVSAGGLSGLFGAKKTVNVGPEEGHVYHGSRGSTTSMPFIQLDQDAGVGDEGGENEENIVISKLDKIAHLIIVANIYGKSNANFAAYDGEVIVNAGGQEFEVPLNESSPGSWCVVAHIDNSGATPQVVNVNKTQRNAPSIGEYA